ncbi:MAG TPA: hypothetical protein PKC21_04770 [Oligoflexia bacterium]|nr:hypothetical protein [Oligoflexia bacterium]HMR24650.1 hypothetical protein [Oligoflexia bacterium]
MDDKDKMDKKVKEQLYDKKNNDKNTVDKNIDPRPVEEDEGRQNLDNTNTRREINEKVNYKPRDNC